MPDPQVHREGEKKITAFIIGIGPAGGQTFV